MRTVRIDILTLFPEMFESPFGSSIIKRAQEKKLVKINLVNLRDFALDRHRQADDYPYGGGAGMVLKADIVIRAIQALRSPECKVVYLTPQGKVLNQALVKKMAARAHLILLCGHYEGIDERCQAVIDEEISIGDYVLTGGEIPAMVVTDAVVRLVPGVLGSDEAHTEESFGSGLLEYPQYTRPRVVSGLEVPPVLVSGDHQAVRRWRKKMSLKRTLLKRPDLLLQREFDPEERELLEEILFSREGQDER